MGSNVTGWGAGGGGTVLTPAQSVWIQGLAAKLYASGADIVIDDDVGALRPETTEGCELGAAGKIFSSVHTAQTEST